MTHVQNTIRRVRQIGLYKPEESRALVRCAQLDQHNGMVYHCRMQTEHMRAHPVVTVNAPAKS